MSKPAPVIATNFLRPIIQKDLGIQKIKKVITRFPPEPNGYLHIGHAKSICLNFGLAHEFNGDCYLRFDDTNPAKEEQEYIDAIKKDIRWLGFEWKDDQERYSSNYFEQLYDWALLLIKAQKAYVCDLSADDVRLYRGNLVEPGKNSPFRERTIEENLDLFTRMRSGEFPDGMRTLRAKIDMSSPNINLRDPTLYRIRHAHHHQTGNLWCIYPSYDFAHGQSDAIEGITHSLCTLEFESHRPLYDWLLVQLKVAEQPCQYEFARLNLSYTVTSKRKLKQLVDEGYVDGWDDPRMSTLSGFRRRGYTPASIRHFCSLIGVNRAGGLVDIGMLEFAIRDELDKTAFRAMCVLNPIKVEITNYPKDECETLTLSRHPKQDMGVRQLPFSNQIYIDMSDFSEDPPSGYKRLTLGGEVRLRGSYVIRANESIKDDKGKNPEGRKVKGVVHWVPADASIDCEVRLYDRLFCAKNPDDVSENGSFLDSINSESLHVIKHCKAEPSLLSAQLEDRFQFEREGYFCLDSKYSKPEALVFNRIVTLRDSWAKK
ncbi:UNVERIFIED_CONTAM: hypothetical protein GTU68_040909 [Idotea baltica]|nr:hypothetical protein [Idotea baltica]